MVNIEVLEDIYVDSIRKTHADWLSGWSVRRKFSINLIANQILLSIHDHNAAQFTLMPKYYASFPKIEFSLKQMLNGTGSNYPAAAVSQQKGECGNQGQ